MANRGIRTPRCRRDDGIWSVKAKAIDAAMVRKHGVTPLTDQALFDLAEQLEHEHDIHEIHRAVDAHPSGKGIKEGLKDIQNSVDIIAAFARDVEIADRTAEERSPLTPELRQRRPLLRRCSELRSDGRSRNAMRTNKPLKLG